LGIEFWDFFWDFGGSHHVPSLVPNDARNVFPKFPCVPQNIANSNTLYPMTFAQNFTLVTYRARLKGKPYIIFDFGTVNSVSVILVMGQIKEVHQPKPKKNNHLGCTPHKSHRNASWRMLIPNYSIQLKCKGPCSSASQISNPPILVFFSSVTQLEH